MPARDKEAFLRRRKRKEVRFRLYGMLALGCASLILLLLLFSIAREGYKAFLQTRLSLPMTFDRASVDPDGTKTKLSFSKGDTRGPLRRALRALFPNKVSHKELRSLYRIVPLESPYLLKKRLEQNPHLVGTTQSVSLPLSTRLLSAARRGESAASKLLASLKKRHLLSRHFNIGFLTHTDSRSPESAGVLGALMGSFWTITLTLLMCFPLGVATAVYLEEVAQKNRLWTLVELSIGNLAAVPSILFGMLGLVLFIHLFKVPRSTPLAGSLVLTLMTLPTVIIATRSSLSLVPQRVRDAALALGASRIQTIFHHTLPQALPGILTGTIIGLSRALGETAPLLMIGMAAFILKAPLSPLNAASSLPTQIYLWSSNPEKAFVALTSGAILVLLGFLFLMNGLAIWLRQKYERRV